MTFGVLTVAETYSVDLGTIAWATSPFWGLDLPCPRHYCLGDNVWLVDCPHDPGIPGQNVEGAPGQATGLRSKPANKAFKDPVPQT